EIEEGASEHGQSPEEFLRATSHRWYRRIEELHSSRIANPQMVNTEGDPLEFCDATYRVLDEDAVVAALQSMDGIEDAGSAHDPPGFHQFVWLESGGDGPPSPYGQIEIRKSRLRLECNSRRRMERGRQLLETNAGSFLDHLGDSFESVKA